MLDTRFPFVLLLAQAETERLLTEALAEAGVAIERDTTLLGITHAAQGPLALLAHGTDREEVQVRWLVGADGAHSTVRHALDIPFPGREWPLAMVLADLDIGLDLGPGEVLAHATPRGLVAFVPFGPCRVRLIGVDHAAPAGATGEPTLSELQSLVDAVLPAPVHLRDATWLARFRPQSRLATMFRVGSVFLAGDAAHVHSPAGGQGMNIGMQDGWNLGWKLAAVALGEAPPAVLDTYERERWAVARWTIRFTDALLSAATVHRPALLGGRAHLARLIAGAPLARRTFGRLLSGVATHYGRDTTIRGLLVPSVVGARVPDVELLAPEGQRVRLYERLRHPGMHLLVLARPRYHARRAAEIVDAVRARFGDRVTPCVVWTEGAPTPVSEAPGFTDIGARLRRALGIEAPCALLLRPDGHVGARALLSVEPVFTALDEWVVPIEQGPGG